MPHEVVLCVHGTYSAEAGDVGRQWWQQGSPFAAYLRKHLPYTIELGPVFHWSGLNTDFERTAASVALRERVRAYHLNGTKVHLIGHSHGGTVIWKALASAITLRLPLDHVSSVTTVGTPFMLYSPTLTDRLIGYTANNLHVVAWGLFTIGALAGLVLGDYNELLEFLGVVLGGGGMAVSAGVILLIFSLPLVFLLQLLQINVFDYVDAAADAENQRRASDSLSRQLRDRWRALTSRLDEAVGALKATADLRADLLPVPTIETAWNETVIGRNPLRVIFWPIRRLGVKTANRIIRRAVQSRSLGVRPVVPLTVTARPAFVKAEDLPAHVDQRLRESAISSLQRRIPEVYDQLMPTLGRLAAGGPTLEPDVPITVDDIDLIHTSYFQDDFVRKRIVAHIANSSQ